MSDFLNDSAATLRRVSQVLDDNGIKYVDLGARAFGVGIGIAYDQNHFVVLTVPGPPNQNQVFLTTGVLRDVNQDRLGLLTLCNTLTNENAAFPTILHDADAGWDILIQQSYPAQLLIDVPPFFIPCLESLAGSCDEHRARFAEIGAAGEAYSWDDANLDRLFMRSLV